MPCGSYTHPKFGFSCSPTNEAQTFSRKPPFFYKSRNGSWTPGLSEQARFSSAKKILSRSRGGSTTLCRSDELWERIEQEIPGLDRESCPGSPIDKGLKYSNAMPAEADLVSGMGRSWQSTLSVDSHEEAEARLTELEYRWEWMEQDELRVTSPTLPAVRELGKGKRSFFNQLIAAFKGWKDTRNDPSKSILMAIVLLSILRKSNGSANWRTKSPLICLGRQATSPSWTTTCACTDDGPSKEPARFSLPWLQHEFWL